MKDTGRKPDSRTWPSESSEETASDSRRRPLKVGVVGFGKVVRDYYLPAFHRLPEMQLVAVADPLLPSRNEAEHRMPGVRTYPTPQELLAHESLDAFLVASPPSTHLELWNALCRLGLPIFMEKPFVLCGQLNRVSRSDDVRPLLMVNLNRRFWPLYQQVAEVLRRGLIGDVQHAEFIFRVNILPWLTITRHRMSPSEGGALYDLGSQAFDVVRTVFGQEPIRIKAEGSDERLMSSQASLEVEFSDGLTIHCELAYGERNCERISVDGTKGKLLLRDPNMTLHLSGRYSTALKVIQLLQDGLVLAYRGIRRGESMLRYTIYASLRAFANAILHGQPFSPGFDDAVKNTLWLETASHSLLNGRPMRVDEVKEEFRCLT